MTAKKPYAEIIIALAVIVFAGILFGETGKIPVSVIYAKVGPNVFPYIISILMGFMGVLLLLQAFKGGWQSEEEKEITIDKHALIWVITGLSLNVLLITKMGFTLASIALFVCVARAFGSRNYLKNAGIATVFALTAYFGFVKLLNINIGGGLIEKFLEGLLK
jgi:putative tricarboxylic transport membrane protein